jgi:hypothetical protein
MTTDRKIRSNRRNAAHSTGPRSPVGRGRSSRNSRRHGFSANYSIDQAQSADAERLALLLADNDTSPQRLAHARTAAEAQLNILRIRAARVTLLNVASVDLTHAASEWSSLEDSLLKELLGTEISAPDCADPERIGLAYLWCLPALIRLDRYERTALARRKRAFRAINRRS